MALRAPPIQGLTLPSLKPSSSSSSSGNANRPCMVRVPPLKSSFFGNQVGAVRVTQLRLVYYDRLRCNSLGGGAAGAGMNLFERLARIFKSYASAILSSFEDPEKIIEQAVNDMNEDLTRMRQATAQVMASQKQLENKSRAAQQSSDDWYKKAQLALAKGDENLAREALKRRKSFADNANAFKAQLDQQKVMVESLVSNTRVLESKIQEAKSKKDGLRARSTAAKTAIKVQEMIGTVDTSGALSAFEKMEEKVLTMESQAEALNQLTTDEFDGKFKMLESSSVEDDLAQLKREQSVSSKKGELPPGRTVVPPNPLFPYRESEVERELNELRRRANDY